MQIIFKKDELLNSINIVSKAISGKTTNPMLECILFDATKNNIKLTTNDEEIAIETKVNGIIKEKGKIAIDAKIISEIVRKANSDEIIIESSLDNNNYKVTITSNKAIFNIQGLNGDDFNYIPYIEKNKYISISQFTLKEVIKQTIFCVAINDSNKMMNGEYLEVKNDELKFIALDGNRVAIRNIKMKDNYENVDAIIPSKTLNDISKIITNDNEKEVLIYFDKNYISFEFDDTILISRLIDGTYFNIEHMLSNDYETKVNINKNYLLNSIEQSMILIRENDHKPIIMDIVDNSLNLFVESSYGKLNDVLECKKSGKDIKIAFNPKFFIDALKNIDDEEISLYMTNPKAPCFIKDEQLNYIYIILPVNFID